MVVVTMSAGATRGIEENGIAYRGHHTAAESGVGRLRCSPLFTAPRAGRIRRVAISSVETTDETQIREAYCVAPAAPTAEALRGAETETRDRWATRGVSDSPNL